MDSEELLNVLPGAIQKAHTAACTTSLWDWLYDLLLLGHGISLNMRPDFDTEEERLAHEFAMRAIRLLLSNSDAILQMAQDYREREEEHDKLLDTLADLKEDLDRISNAANGAVSQISRVWES